MDWKTQCSIANMSAFTTVLDWVPEVTIIDAVHDQHTTTTAAKKHWVTTAWIKSIDYHVVFSTHVQLLTMCLIRSAGIRNVHVVLITLWLLPVEALQSHCPYITYLPLPGNIWICILWVRKSLRQHKNADLPDVAPQGALSISARQLQNVGVLV